MAVRTPHPTACLLSILARPPCIPSSRALRVMVLADRKTAYCSDTPDITCAKLPLCEAGTQSPLCGMVTKACYVHHSSGIPRGTPHRHTWKVFGFPSLASASRKKQPSSGISPIHSPPCSQNAGNWLRFRKVVGISASCTELLALILSPGGGG